MPKIRLQKHQIIKGNADRTMWICKLLRNYIEEVYVRARLRRIDDWPGDEAFLAEVLAEFEATGDAMRYVNARGQITWKATPKLRDHLHDMRLDAEDDLALGQT